MQAFHGNAAVKEFFLSRVRAHRKADELIRGRYWENGKGCAVGCTIHSGDHAEYEEKLGIPRILARLEDGIFESLPNGKAMEWPEKFLSAITPGSDLSRVWPQFAVWMLTDEKWGVRQFAKSDGARQGIQAVADAYQSVIDGKSEKPNWKELNAAAAAAAAAATATAADADADVDANANAAAAAAAAAYAAVYAAAYAAAAAAAAAATAAYAAIYADAATAVYARTKWRIAQSEKLIELLRTSPVPSKRS